MRDADIRILERRLSELNADISNIESEMDRADAKLRNTYGERLKSIQERRRGVQERLAELRLQKALAWEQNEFVTGVERVLDRIGRGQDRMTTRKR